MRKPLSYIAGVVLLSLALLAVATGFSFTDPEEPATPPQILYSCQVPYDVTTSTPTGFPAQRDFARGDPALHSGLTALQQLA